MIYLYTGTPGSGKSYHVAKDIYFYLYHCCNVIANFDINVDAVPSRKRHPRGYFFQKENHELDPDWLMEFAILCHNRNQRGRIIEGQTWFIIDECQLLFNCRSWNGEGRDKWNSFFTQHRKYGYNIILITQFDRLVDRQIRSLVEYEVKHRKANNFGIGGFFVSLFLLGRPLFVAITYWYGARERCGSSMCIGIEKYYRIYDSYKLFEIPGNETAVDYNVQPISAASTPDTERKKKERGNKIHEPKDKNTLLLKGDEKPIFRDEERAS